MTMAAGDLKEMEASRMEPDDYLATAVPQATRCERGWRCLGLRPNQGRSPFDRTASLLSRRGWRR